MEEYPNWGSESSGGSDLPRPRKKTAQDSAPELPRTPAPQSDLPPAFSQPQSAPQVTPAPKPVTPPSQPSGPEKPHTPAKPEQPADDRKSYGRDTMQFRTPFRDTEFDTDFERRRAAPLPPSQPNKAKPAQNHAPRKKPQEQGKPVPQNAAPRKKPQEQGKPVPQNAAPRKKPQEQRKPAVQRPAQPAPAKPKKRRLNPFGRFLRGMAVLAASLFLVYSCISLFLISRLERMTGESRSVTDGALDASYVTSILLIGTDARNASERGRSDSMILVSLNSRTKSMYLTSFMRDAYVEIPGHGKDKLNAAYSYGGAALLMDTLELNYGVSVDDCMNVSFSGFAGVIDAFGGVEITMSDAEAQALNEILISEVNELMGDARDADLLDGGGSYQLNGKQALSYSRIRYVGNADFERTSRQREVMTQLFANLKTRMVTAVPELVSSALPHVGTNMSTGEMYLLSLRAPFVLGYDIEQIQIPADGTWSGQTMGGQSVLMVDFAENKKILQETVYAATK